MRLVEPYAVTDTFTSGLGRVEVLRGNNLRLTYFADATMENGRVERIVVAKIIIPLDGVPDGWDKIKQAITTNKPIKSPEFVVAAH